jgi:solute carrier family 20 (sodium-dependent phosphate transporter)
MEEMTSGKTEMNIKKKNMDVNAQISLFSNAIGPLIAIWLIYTEGSVLQKSESPILILLYGGFGIVIGLWVFGRRVVETIGTNLTKITPAT